MQKKEGEELRKLTPEEFNDLKEAVNSLFNSAPTTATVKGKTCIMITKIQGLPDDDERGEYFYFLELMKKLNELLDSQSISANITTTRTIYREGFDSGRRKITAMDIAVQRGDKDNLPPEQWLAFELATGRDPAELAGEFKPAEFLRVVRLATQQGYLDSKATAACLKVYRELCPPRDI